MINQMKVKLQIKPTIYNRILIRTLNILVNLDLLSNDDAVAYYKREATFKWRIGERGKWTIIKGS